MNNLHFSSATPEWYTPEHIVGFVRLFFGTIDLDPCSNSPLDPNIPAERHYTKESNGLAQPWYGRVYMNPPYGRSIREWVAKLVAEYENGNVEAAIALVYLGTDWGRFSDEFGSIGTIVRKVG